MHMQPRRLTSQAVSLLTLTLLAASGFGCVLLLGRFWRSENHQFAFLVWNLLLAWFPFVFALMAADYWNPVKPKPLKGWFALIAWLLAFPNAPYIVTDFIHMKYAHGAPWWFDVAMLLTFSGTGIVLGLASLYIVHCVVAEQLGARMGWLFASGSMLLCGFGIYLGRFLRWNSWDVLTNPLGLVYDIAVRLVFPQDHVWTMAVSLIFGTLLGLMYLALYAFTLLEPKQEPAPIPIRER
ncbi:MAG: DUF1361 domain-containing protein [bacterium]